MRRIEMCHTINRNNPAISNGVNSNELFVNNTGILGNQTWLNQDVATGVEIIELDDSDDSQTSDESPKDNFDHAWCYVNNTRASKELQDVHRVNTIAREKRRLKDRDRQNLFSPCEYVHNNNTLLGNTVVTAGDNKNNVRLNHQINCFTIINKHFINSDTSSENIDYDNIEMVRPIGDAFKENHDFNNVFGDELLSDSDAEKKTIWIYSFKNKHLLSDDYIEMINIPSNETDSCNSFSFEKFDEDSENIIRAASPIPPPFIPRLNLSLAQTLSTVTEITEPNKHPSSVETDRSGKVPVNQKPKNSWLFNNYKDGGDNQEKSTNVVNWMALSPRERRRIYRERDSKADVIYKGKLATLKEVCPNGEAKVLDNQDNGEKIETYNNIHSRTVDVEIHVIPKLDIQEVESKGVIVNVSQPDTKHIEVDDENVVEVIADNENIEVIMCSPKPQIKISKKCINAKAITEPIEKLNTDNWIVEESAEHTIPFSFDLERTVDNNFNRGDSALTANDRLWSKNALALMKPAQWNEYAPIAESHLSLHLSLDSTIDKQSWLSRLIKLFKCCN
ncbi:uncharacterized protein LOC119188646 [Manduca sexta]|uniref:uncharacterized protein LOC119188646 n=1 Tax=Manduca sexta TaxID=7130 RepID=UPI0018900664|nr:uncharacterized protein LOC119188646 [Manduca sexta]